MKVEKGIKAYSKYDNNIKHNFKRKDSKQTKVTLLIKDYFKSHNSLTKEQFDDFLKFIDLKSIWYTKEEQNILWNSIISNSKNKFAINYDSAFKGIMDLFKEDDDEIKNKSNKKNKSVSMEEIKIKFDKYLKSLNGNEELLYDIEFINYIFLDKDAFNLNKNNIENIINEIRIKYKFITINGKDITNYFSYFNFNINREIINNINTLIENILFEQNKNNNNNISFSYYNNNDSRSFSNSSNNENNGELLDRLLEIDKIIFDCMDSLIYFYSNKNLIELTKKYIQNYLLLSKNKIYNNLKVIFENNNKIMSDSIIPFQNEESNINDNLNINNNNLIFIKKEKPKSKYLSKSELINVKKDQMHQKSYSNLLNINKIIEQNNEDLKESKKSNKKNNADASENLFSLNYNKKLKKNISYRNLKELNRIKEFEPFNLNQKGEKLSRNFHYNLTEKKGFKNQRNDESSLFENSIEDSNIFSFSDTINEQYLIKTANLENLDENLINKGTPTLNPLESIDNKDPYFNEDLNYYKDFLDENKIIDQNININQEKNDLQKIQNLNNFTFGKAENPDNEKIKIKLSGDIDCNIPNYTNNFKLSSNDSNKKFIKIGYYDFKYLYKNNHIKKLFNLNHEKINPMKFLTDEVNIIQIKDSKKQKAILMMSGSSFYLLNANNQMNCLSKKDNKSLKCIFISSRNCNLILFSFESASDILIETYRRLEILKFIKEIIKDKNIKINISHNFAIKKKHGDNDSVNLKKSKLLTYSPNFENALKIGVLYKYQEYFFSNKFHERLVVLCCLGLMYFEENDKSPKVIIPIIGTTIKFLTAQEDQKLYCFQLKTINDDRYIFGSKIYKEILDWIQEFSMIKKRYFLKLKEIEPNLVVYDKNKFHKQKGK